MKNRGKRSIFVGACIAMASVLGLSACGAADQGDDTAVTFAVGSPNLEITTAPYVAVPEQMGFWKDEGLDVDVQGTEGATASVQMLVGGRADIINGGTSSFFQEAARNPDIQVISLTGPNVWRVYVPEESPIQSIEELKGKTVGAQSLSSASYLFGVAALESGGVDTETEVDWLPIGTGNQAAEALNSGHVEAYASYDGPAGVVGNLTTDGLRALPSELDNYNGLLGIATLKETIEQRPDVVEKFLIGLIKGAIFSATNPEAAIDLQFKQFPEQRPQGSWEEVLTQMMPVAETRFVDGGVQTDGLPVGTLSAEDVQSSIQLMNEYDVIAEDVSAEDVLAFDLNNEAWSKVDPAEIAQMAEDYNVE